MTTVNEHTIAEELRRMAGEARPVDAHALAVRAASRTARRRRAPWLLAAAAALVAGAVTVSSFGTDQMTARVAGPSAPRLPDNTPEQLRLVRACMPAGGPSVNVNPDWRDPAHGTAADFRVLAEYRDENGSSALVGSTKGFVVCTAVGEKELREPPVFTYWGNKAPGSLTGFPGGLSVDVYTNHYRYSKVSPHDTYVLLVAGRVAPGVSRVTVDWSDGRRTQAVVTGGFFIAGTPAKATSRRNDRSFVETDVDTPSATVTAYDAAGRIAGTRNNVEYGWRGPVGTP
ncbi:hypothetical protein [Nonomuraea sp. NPDC050691]|uniref:hypothetical protein n=1 Tax=Nonomuraea sp. NPDC050691 TaxID=3155661 RepID=UPI0033F42DE2